MAQASFMDSTGIHCLIRTCRAMGAPGVVRNPSAPPLRLFNLMETIGLDRGTWVVKND